MATAHAVGVLRLTPFPAARRGGPCKTNAQKVASHNFYSFTFVCKQACLEGKIIKGIDFSIPFCFVVLRRGRDSNPRYSCPYTAFRVRPVRPLRHLSYCNYLFCGCKYNNFFLMLSSRKPLFSHYDLRVIQRHSGTTSKSRKVRLWPHSLIFQRQRPESEK